MQRLQLARVLFMSPLLVFIDEGTSAMEPAAEAAILDAITEAGTAIVATAQLESRIKQQFGIHVQLQGDSLGTWNIARSPSSRRQS